MVSERRWQRSRSALMLAVLPFLTLGIWEKAASPLRASNQIDAYRQVSAGSQTSTREMLLGLIAQAPKKPGIPKEGTETETPTPEAPAEDAPAEEAPAAAEGTGAGGLALPTASSDEIVTVPKSSAIIVSFPAELTLDPKRLHNVPITLPLVRPIVDSEGNIVAPVNSLVSARLTSMKGGDLIEVIAVVVGGRVIPINTLGTLVPAQNSGEEIKNPVPPNPGLVNNTLVQLQSWQQSIGGFVVSNSNRITTTDLIGLGLSIGVGVTTPVPKLPPRLVSITQGAIYILTLATPVTIPKRLVETGIQIEQNAVDAGVATPGQ